MAKPKNDFTSIGNLYGGMLNSIKHKLVSEGKVGPKVGEIGEAPLVKGGPQTTAGYMPAKIDKKTMSKKDVDDNLYNIDALSYDEDEETKKVPKKAMRKKTNHNKSKVVATKDHGELVKESGKIAKERLNNFMRRKSIFDKLYENVMQPGGAPSGPESGEMDDSQELDALGIDGEGDDMGGEGEVTFTLDRATAEKLLDVLNSAMDPDSEEDMMGDDEFSDEGSMDDMGDEDEEGFWDEDEEELGGAKNLSTEINYGKNNKVSNLKTQSGGASSAYTDKVGNDGDHGHALHGAKQPNMGKSNKVSKLKTGKSLFEQ